MSRLIAVGDVSLGDHPVCVGYGVRSTFDRDQLDSPLYPFTAVADSLASADIVFGNLETVLSSAGVEPGRLESLEMRGRPEAGPVLARAGFTVLNVANNHTLQHGPAAFTETLSVVQSCGIAAVGVAEPMGAGGCAPVHLVTNGIRVAFLGYAYEPDRFHKGPTPYAFGPSCDVLGDVRRARRQADLVVCSMHWGDEFMRQPPRWAVRLAHDLVDAGARIVLGHHPHVFCGIERYGGGIVAYSLGNFVFDMLWDRWLRFGLLLEIDFDRHSVMDVVPRFVHIGLDYQPRLVTDESHRALLAELDRLNVRVSDPPDEETYRRERRRLIRRNRLQSYGHFLRHLRQIPPDILKQNLARTLRRRIEDVSALARR